jgi:hypothetical protein
MKGSTGCPREPVRTVRAIRKANPAYSAKKIRPILLRKGVSVPRVTTLGRLINREYLFFRPDIPSAQKPPKEPMSAHESPTASKRTGHGSLSGST